MRKRSNDSQSGSNAKRPKLNPLDVAVDMLSRVQDEEKGAYKVVYDRLRELDRSHPKVAENHYSTDFGSESMDYATANLLFSAHAALMYPEQPLYSRKAALDAVKFMHKVPGGPTYLLLYVQEHYPQAVLCVEHLYFLNRQVRRFFTLPDAERPEALRGQKIEEWTFPDAAIDELRVFVIDLWKNLEEADHADEA